MDCATMIEYGLIAALVALVLIGALTTLGTSLETAFEGVNAGFAEPT
jgi:pilus assembly protein Flp/PilA